MVAIIYVTTLILLLLILEDYSAIIVKLYTTILILWFTIITLKLSSRMLMKQEVIFLKKSIYQRSNNLYEWTGKSDIEKYFFYKLLNKPVKDNALDNLREIKDIFVMIIGNDKRDYQLLKKYFDVYEKNNITEKFSTIFWGFLITVSTTALVKIGTSPPVVDKVFIFFSWEEGGKLNSLRYLETILDISTFLFIIVLFIFFIISDFSRDKRRNELLKSVIELIIDEENEKTSLPLKSK